jgi:Plastocyanin
MRSTRIGRVSSLAAIVGILLGALFAAPSTAKAPSVGITGSSIANYKFQPKTLSVSKGTTVHWNWSSNAPHNVTFPKLGKHSATRANGSYKLKFKHTGTFKYHCTIHGFKGKIVVN